MSGAAASPKIMNEIRMSPMIINLPSFPLNLRFLNLSDNKGSLVTIRSDKITVYISRTAGDSVNDFSKGIEEKFAAITTEMTAIAFAGVGNPLKDVV
jgi:hypothetical protein